MSKLQETLATLTQREEDARLAKIVAEALADAAPVETWRLARRLNLDEDRLHQVIYGLVLEGVVQLQHSRRQLFEGYARPVRIARLAPALQATAA